MEHAIVLGVGLVVGVVLFLWGIFMFMAGMPESPEDSGAGGAGCIIMIVGALMALACLVRGAAMLARAFGL